jgi:sugar phosphate isomerase/epimerase
MRIPIALQLYSVRHDCATDLLGVIAQVAKMGYDGVEFAGYHGHKPADIKKVLDDHGLKAEGTHTGWNLFDDENLNETIETHKILDCTYAIIPGIPENLRNTQAACLETAAKLTALTDRLRPHGIQTGFHAHAGDMTILDGGTCSLRTRRATSFCNTTRQTAWRAVLTQ